MPCPIAVDAPPGTEAPAQRLRRIAAEHGLSLNALAAMVDASRGDANLSSAIRVFVLGAQSAACFQRESTPDGVVRPDQ